MKNNQVQELIEEKLLFSQVLWGETGAVSQDLKNRMHLGLLDNKKLRDPIGAGTQQVAK